MVVILELIYSIKAVTTKRNSSKPSIQKIAKRFKQIAAVHQCTIAISNPNSKSKKPSLFQILISCAQFPHLSHCAARSHSSSGEYSVQCPTLGVCTTSIRSRRSCRLLLLLAGLDEDCEVVVETVMCGVDVDVEVWQDIHVQNWESSSVLFGRGWWGFGEDIGLDGGVLCCMLFVVCSVWS